MAAAMPVTSSLPVFIKNRDIPNSDSVRPDCLELCIAAERVSGRGSVIGAQDIKGLWRIYPATKEARNELLIKGIIVRDVSVTLHETNPFSIRDDGVERPSTKVFIDGIPISVADSEIEHSLVKLGCELRSAIKHERARDSDGKLTRFITGKRFVFITIPTTPLEKSMLVSVFTASVYHKEQRAVKKTVVCSKCLSTGHHVSSCVNEVVCRTCKQTGHKRGDPVCDPNSVSRNNNNTHRSQQASVKNSDNISNPSTPYPPQTLTPSSLTSTNKNNSDTPSTTTTSSGHRSRTASRQDALRSQSLDVRGRSESSKRRRSNDNDSPKGPSDKQQKHLEEWLTKPDGQVDVP